MTFALKARHQTSVLSRADDSDVKHPPLRVDGSPEIELQTALSAGAIFKVASAATLSSRGRIPEVDRSQNGDASQSNFYRPL
jgi:hypothetical protein